MPRLALLSLNDSLSAMWPALAAECELELVTLAEPAQFHRLTDAVGLVAGAGDEERIEATLLQAAGGGSDIAAVGVAASHRVAAEVMRAGAADYFALPGDEALLRSWVRDGAERLRADARCREFAGGEGAKYRFDGILGESPALHAALARAARVIPHPNVTVLITGETGTGKELLARAIHYNGPRREAPFVDINCAAIPEQLLESELFGHEKGAFTSAAGAKPGLFELANGGTLFLDEIGHLALPLQGKLLRALEERTIRRVGGTRAIAVDVRVVAATHVDLATAAERGEFREDLYYRLNVVPIVLPPLRERPGDIAPLAARFLARFAAEYGLPVPSLSEGATAALTTRRWRGNVRELRNALERAVLLASGPELDAADLALDAEPDAGGNAHANGRANGNGGHAASGALPFPATVEEITRAAAVAMMRVCGGNKSEASRRLGISRPRLQRLLDSVGELVGEPVSEREVTDA